ncbi:putative transposase of the Rover4 hAT-like family [Lachancea mirantina]|uniref:Putative transposase of the Rover4 hAT-like family n=1 Tax=Lachancea mirantina TaxID=1230905 RepID=A0A1G4KC67_9SACH|nr:putative transposase of the Rover4 hAT-like family [Lachancea mirantina]
MVRVICQDGLQNDQRPLATRPKRSAVKSSASGWMLKSSLRPFFDFIAKDGERYALCKYCGKQYREGESTGNLAKHVRGQHRTAFEQANNRIGKGNVVHSLAKRRSTSLRLSRAIQEEFKQKPLMIDTVLLVVEKFLPFSFVESAAWSQINENHVSGQLIQSRTTLSKKVDLYSKYMNDSLHLNLRDTQLVNLVLDVWTAGNGESFLAIMVSFVPNLFKEEAVKAAISPSPFLDRLGKAQNTHLLDFVSLGSKRHSGQILCTLFLQLMDKHGLTDKVGTITMDNAANNGTLYSHLIHNNYKISKPLPYRLLGKTRYIRCASHVLNLQFQKIMNYLLSKRIFADPFSKIIKLSKVIRYSTRIRMCLAEFNAPLLPLDSQTRWMTRWRQIHTFLKNRHIYEACCEKIKDSGNLKLAMKLRELIIFDARTLELLQYFVDVCKIMNETNLQLQHAENNCLPNAAPVYYLMDHFYQNCTDALAGYKISRSSSDIDFSCLNGSSALHPDDKRLILDSMAIAKSSHEKYFIEFRSNPVYHVSFILDPRSKSHGLYNLMSASYAVKNIQKSEMFIMNYLKEYESCCPSHPSNATPQRELKEKDRYFAFTLKNRDADKIDTSDNSNENSVALDEWNSYLAEPRLALTSKEAAVNWWFERRYRFPRLFKLAMCLFYTKISTCDVERTFSLAGRVMRKDRKKLHGKALTTLMTLRDRFVQFNFYKKNVGKASFEDQDIETNDSESSDELETYLKKLTSYDRNIDDIGIDANDGDISGQKDSLSLFDSAPVKDGFPNFDDNDTVISEDASIEEVDIIEEHDLYKETSLHDNYSMTEDTLRDKATIVTE